MHVPAGLRAGQRVPLVLGLHGAGQDGRGFEGESNFTQVADEHRFVVAYPQSWRARGFWQYPEADNERSGLRLLRAAIAGVARVACVDRGRVLVTGISSGGRMTYAAGCELADRILAIAPVSGGTRQLPPCRPARPISVLDVHGTADRIVAYRGRGADHDGRVETVLEAWAQREGCRPEPRERRIAHYVTRLDWSGCRSGRAGRAPARGGRRARLAAARGTARDRPRRSRGDLALLRGTAVPVGATRTATLRDDSQWCAAPPDGTLFP